MRNGSELYSLTAYIMKVWENADEAGRAMVWNYLHETQKPIWFKRVIFKHSQISYEDLHDIAEDTFITSWNSFESSGRLGKLNIEEPSYLGYLFRSFKNNFLKGLARRQKALAAEKEYGRDATHEPPPSSSIDQVDFFSPRTARCLQQLSPDGRQLLIWRHVDGKTYDEIAALKNIERESAIKLASRYKQQFLELWKNTT